MKKKEETTPGELLDDRIVRLIGIPFFGIVIPSATGILDFGVLSLGELILHFGYFIFLALIIWQGNRWLLIKYYPIFYNSDSVIQKYVLMIGLNVLFTGPLATIMLFGWKYLSNSTLVSNRILLITTVAIVICVIFVTNIYEKVLFIAQRDNEKIKSVELEQAKVQAELDALKNQIDPHFMFNSLNGLSHLVENDPQKAQLFIENLAEIYRYILKSKNNNLVFLRDEISFIEAYASLMQIRYEENFQVDIHIDNVTRNDYLIPPVSIMVALENAAKHNEISSKKPLIINIRNVDDQLFVSNVIELKRKAFESTKLGLANLNDRFEKTIGKGIHVNSSSGSFVLKMPLIKLTQA